MVDFVSLIIRIFVLVTRVNWGDNRYMPVALNYRVYFRIAGIDFNYVIFFNLFCDPRVQFLANHPFALSCVMHAL